MYHEDWETNEFPAAYFITIRTYGTWLHGDERGSVDIHGQNIYGTPRIKPNRDLERKMEENLKRPPFTLNKKQRKVVEETIRESCKFRGFEMHAVNARSNHVHAVISAQILPEKLIKILKARTTRILHEQGLIQEDISPWSRGRSRKYLWKPHHVSGAVDYVLYCQSDKPFELDDVE